MTPEEPLAEEELPDDGVEDGAVRDEEPLLDDVLDGGEMIPSSDPDEDADW